jgi:hypothetical protein
MRLCHVVWAGAVGLMGASFGRPHDDPKHSGLSAPARAEERGMEERMIAVKKEQRARFIGFS